MNRKQLVLIALLGALAISVLYAYWAAPRQERVSPTRQPRATRAVPKSIDDKAVVKTEGRVMLELLEAEGEVFPGAKRDIFSFYVHKVAPPKPSQVAPPPPPPVVAPPPVMPVAPPNVMQRELARFTFLGFMVKGEEKTVFLSSGTEVYLAQKGETFGKQQEFLVESIDERELVVSRKGQPGTMSVSLVVNEKLSPTISTPARSLGGSSTAPAPARPVFQQPGATLQRRGPVRFRPPTPSGGSTEQEQTTIQTPGETGAPLEGGPDGSDQ